MAVALKIPGASRNEQDDSRYAALLQGYRFTVCSTRRDAERALEIRRRVYVDETGYDISVPDEYDGHSWILLAEDAATGQAVGTMRITSRSEGPLEAEEYFRRGEEQQQVAGQAEIIVAKQRNGPVGKVDLVWQKEYTRFEDQAPDRFNEFDNYNEAAQSGF